MPKIVNHQERKQAFTQATKEVIAQKGLNSVRLIDVAKSIGATTGSLGHYFSDKEELPKDLLLENIDLPSGINFRKKTGIKHFFSIIENNHYFNIFVSVVIIFTGIIVGVETDVSLVEEYPTFFSIADQTIKYIFLVEIIFFITWITCLLAFYVNIVHSILINL